MTDELRTRSYDNLAQRAVIRLVIEELTDILASTPESHLHAVATRKNQP